MMNRQVLRSEARRLNLHVSDVKQIYREMPRYRAPAPLPPSSYLHPGDKNVQVSGQLRYKFFENPLVGNQDILDEQSSPNRVVPRGISLDAPPPQAAQDSADGGIVRAARKRALRKRKFREMPQDDLVKVYPVQDPGYYGRTVSTQTMFRENEVQTDPYTHDDLLIPDGEQPEVLGLADLTYKNGLNPINKETLKEIDRIRRRRMVEASLPMGRDKESFEKRCMLLKQLELIEWNEREERIRKEQEKKFRQLRKRVAMGQEEIVERNQLRKDILRNRINDQLEHQLNVIKKKRMKALATTLRKYQHPAAKTIAPGQQSGSEYRKRTKKLKTSMYLEVGPSTKTFDMLSQYSGLTQPAKPSALGYEVHPGVLNDPSEIERIERKFEESARRRLDGVGTDAEYTEETGLGVVGRGELKRLGIYKKRKLKTTLRKENQVRKDIDFMKNIKRLKLSKKKQEKDLLSLYKKTPRIYRPPTPTEGDFQDMDDELENSIILIQKLLRGRAVQNRFTEGKANMMELIKELQEVEKVVLREKDIKKEKDHIIAEEKKKREKEIQNFVDTIQGEVIGKSLDYLSKELIRQKELEKIEMLKVKAEVEREAREARERTKRTELFELRKREQVQYNEMVKANNLTIETFLDDLFEKSVEKYSYFQALNHMKNEMSEKLKKINNEREEEKEKNKEMLMKAVESSMSETGGEEDEEEHEGEEDDLEVIPDIVKITPSTDENEIRDLVNSFLLPQVRREMVKKKLRLKQRKYIKAVQDVLFNDDQLLNISAKKNDGKEEEGED